MLVSELQESSKENRIFKGEVIEKTEVCSGLCRLMLKDEQENFIYCMIQGMQ